MHFNNQIHKICYCWCTTCKPDIQVWMKHTVNMRTVVIDKIFYVDSNDMYEKWNSVSSIGREINVCTLWSIFGVCFQYQYFSHRLVLQKDHTWMWSSKNSPYVEVNVLNPDSTPRTGIGPIQFYTITCCKHCSNIWN